MKEPDDHFQRQATEVDEWTLRKLKAETSKIEQEIPGIQRAGVWQAMTTVASLSTTVIALFALMSTNISQRKQSEREEIHRKEERYDASVRMFGESTSSLAQLSAVGNLAGFWDDTLYRARAASLLVLSANQIRDRTVRAAIRQLILEHPDTLTLRLLVQDNRLIQVRLRGLGYSAFDVFPANRVWHPSAPGDSAVALAYTDLGWNIDLAIATINQMKTIRDFDLRGVVFSRIGRSVPGVLPEDLIRFDDERFASRLEFYGVDLTNANLAAVSFDDVTFLGTSLDSTLLADTEFHQSRLGAGTTLRDFRTQVPAENHDIDYPFWPRLHNRSPVWSESDVRVGAFYPLRYEDEKVDSIAYFQFRHSTWRIENTIPEGSAMHRIPLPPWGEQQDFTAIGRG